MLENYKDVLTVAELKEILNYSSNTTVYKLLNEGVIKARKVRMPSFFFKIFSKLKKGFANPCRIFKNGRLKCLNDTRLTIKRSQV